MKIRKLLAGGLAATLVGATFGVLAVHAQSASLGDFVRTSGSSLSSPSVVIGNPASPSAAFANDVVGAADIAAAVAGYATTPVVVPGGANLLSITGGVSLATASQPLFVGSAIDTAKESLSDLDLPDVLASGELQADDGAEYDYEQFIRLGSRRIVYDDSSGDLEDPDVIVNIGTDEANPLFTFEVDFTDSLAISGTAFTAGVQNNVLNIFGGGFTVDSETTSTAPIKLVLNGGGTKIKLSEGTTQTVSVDGSDYEVELLSVADPNTINVCINADCDSVDEGVSRTLSGLAFLVLNVFHNPKDTGISSAELIVGSRKLVLEHNAEVKIGESEDVLSNTLVTITNETVSSVNRITNLKIDVSAADSNEDFLQAGDSMTDPVFGILKLAFNGLRPALDDASRAKITIQDSGSSEETVDVKNRNSDFESFVFAFDSDTSSTTNTLTFGNEDGDNIVVVEGDLNIGDNDFFMLSQGDFDKLDMSRLLEVVSISGLSSNSAKISLRDVFSDNTFDIDLGSDNADTKSINGFDFFFNVTSTTSGSETFQVTWGTGARIHYTGKEVTVYPLIETENEGLMALTAPVNITNTTSASYTGIDFFKLDQKIVLPTGVLNVTNATAVTSIGLTPIVGSTIGSQTSIIPTGDLGEANITVGRVGYTVKYFNATMTLRINLQRAANQNPAVLFIENEDDDNNFEAIIFPTSNSAEGKIQLDGGNIFFTSAATNVGTFETTENTDVARAVDEWGTLVERNTDNEDTAFLLYPREQAVADLAIGPDPVAHPAYCL
ncbi:MAG: hypothetical protein HY518_02050 [Candidatus Aenigmarchaeota archaeon]|nr:hypothetical protein [Candidatus Aenigmarchaeota archaeon]